MGRTVRRGVLFPKSVCEDRPRGSSKQRYLVRRVPAMTRDRPGSILHYLHKLLGAPGPAGVNDAELLRRFVAGRDEAAFELLLWRHGAAVLNLCRHVLGDDHAAEDAFQATFLVLVRKAGSNSNRE